MIQLHLSYRMSIDFEISPHLRDFIVIEHLIFLMHNLRAYIHSGKQQLRVISRNRKLVYYLSHLVKIIKRLVWNIEKNISPIQPPYRH